MLQHNLKIVNNLIIQGNYLVDHFGQIFNK